MISFLSLDGWEKTEVQDLIGSAGGYADLLAHGNRDTGELSGKVVTTVFYEPSTRTRLSFEQAARFLGAHVMTFTPEGSSVAKGESLKDTARTLSAIGTDVFVVRHQSEDGPRIVAEATGLPVVNGGTGRSDHPTQALGDILTLMRRFGKVEGLRMAIVGDIANSRVARSHLHLSSTLDVEVTLVGPQSLIPSDKPSGVLVTDDLDAILEEVDVLYMLRVQRERGAEIDASYTDLFQLSSARAERMHPEAVVMHPGPMNRGIEIESAVADGPRSLISQQVELGVPTRMAVLAAAIGMMK